MLNGDAIQYESNIEEAASSDQVAVDKALEAMVQVSSIRYQDCLKK